MRKVLLLSFVLVSFMFTGLVAQTNIVEFDMLPSGELKIYTKQGKEWKEQGSLGFYTFFQTKNLKLDGIDYSKPLQVKIVKSGGAVEIDFISVAGLIPMASKVRAMDNDSMSVVDQVEFQFAGAFEDEIVITAKIDV